MFKRLFYVLLLNLVAVPTVRILIKFIDSFVHSNEVLLNPFMKNRSLKPNPNRNPKQKQEKPRVKARRIQTKNLKRRRNQKKRKKK